jgi:hypothetical protein
MSPKEPLNPRGKIVKVTIEHESGLIVQVAGEEARKWQEAVESTSLFCWAHSVEFPALQWKIVRRPKNPN